MHACSNMATFSSRLRCMQCVTSKGAVPGQAAPRLEMAYPWVCYAGDASSHPRMMIWLTCNTASEACAVIVSCRPGMQRFSGIRFSAPLAVYYKMKNDVPCPTWYESVACVASDAVLHYLSCTRTGNVQDGFTLLQALQTKCTILHV